MSRDAGVSRNVAARGCGAAQRAVELGVDYSQQRHTVGKPTAKHRAVQFKLAEMSTTMAAAPTLAVGAARRKDSGEHHELEAEMAEYLASQHDRQVGKARPATTAGTVSARSTRPNGSTVRGRCSSSVKEQPSHRN